MFYNDLVKNIVNSDAITQTITILIVIFVIIVFLGAIAPMIIEIFKRKE